MRPSKQPAPGELVRGFAVVAGEVRPHALEEPKTTASETLLHGERLSEARREHLQLQNELSLATEEHNRLIRKKNVMQPA